MSEDASAPARWNVPAIDGSDGDGFLTASKLEAIQKAAYDEAWAKGHEQGMAAGAEALERRVKRLDELLRALARPFDELDEQVEKQLVDLAMTAVRQLFRREIHTEPEHVIGVVREAVQLLPVASRNVQIHVHPDDAALIRQSLKKAEGEPAWALLEDPLVERGGCRITTDNSQVDASNDKRLQALISTIVGDERGE